MKLPTDQEQRKEDKKKNSGTHLECKSRNLTSLKEKSRQRRTAASIFMWDLPLALPAKQTQGPLRLLVS